ncbi:ELM1/GtrOC1 family putative glycosyltransferase (plasmid) [Microbulbifer sp. MKSA007]|nr:ELM1/GtrOC1 family putative glycosyltransferase [Microbulbifer sp. MKSA007]
MQKETKDIFVIRCNILGDQNNILGLAKALQEEFGGVIKILDIRFRSRMFETLFLHLIQQKQFGRILEQIASLFCIGDIPSKADVQDAFVISTLGSGELPAAFLSKSLGGFSIHLGEVKRIPPEMVDLVISHPGHTAKRNEYQLPYAPSQIDGKALVPPAERSKLLVAFGGNAGSHQYSEEYYYRVLHLAASIAKKESLELSVTTSHRTGTQNETKIKKYIHESNIKVNQLILYSEGDSPSMQSLLNDAACAIVSAESVSMVSEALASFTKTVAVYEHSLPRELRISRFLKDQSDSNQISLVDVCSSNRIDVQTMETPSISWKRSFLSAVHYKLNKKKIEEAA